MLKIKVSTKEKSDVTRYFARNWSIQVFRNYKTGEYFVAERDNIQFVVNEDDDGMVVVTKYIDGIAIDQKTVKSDNCGIGGTLYINDHRDIEKIYAFFRNERLQDLLDHYGITKLTFMGDSEIPEYRTLSTNVIVGQKTYDWNPHFIKNAKFIYDVDKTTLILPHNYDIEYIEQSIVKELETPVLIHIDVNKEGDDEHVEA